MSKLVGFRVSPERFRVLKEAYERGLKNFRMEQPHQHAMYYNSVLLSERVWLKGECLDEMPRLTAEAVQEFVPR